MTDRETRNERYIAGMCADCGKRRYSAGRPRCDECHELHTNQTPTE